MRAFVLAAMACGLAAGAARAQGPDPDGEIWLTGFATGSVKGPLLATGDISLRLDDTGTRAGTTLFRGAIGWQVAKKVSLWQGYVRVAQFPAGRPGVYENRLFQQVIVNPVKIGPGTLFARTRLEQRMVEGQTQTGWRLRQQLRYTVPIKGSKTTVVLHTEPFVALNSTRWGASAGFDQLRTFAGFGVPLTRGVIVDIGYMNRYVRRSGARDRIDHILPVTVNYRF